MEAQVTNKKPKPKFFFDSKPKKSEWVTYFEGDCFTKVLSSDFSFVNVRDFKNKVMYEGCIVHFNNENCTELFLKDVIVRDFACLELYRCDYMYINLSNKNYTLEFTKT